MKAQLQGSYVDSFWQLFYILLLFLFNFSASSSAKVCLQGMTISQDLGSQELGQLLYLWEEKAGELQSLLSMHSGIDKDISYVSGGSCNNHHKVSQSSFLHLQDS